jgi:antitoxin component YwqK of YwqJK toxin-antitoxin module
MVFCSSILFAQNKNVEPTYKHEGELVAVTTYYKDGKIMEQGFYKDKKLHGEWNKFDKSGMKITKAFYNDGIKTGKWIFLNKGKITEVVYDQNKIAAVTELKSEHLAIN